MNIHISGVILVIGSLIIVYDGLKLVKGEKSKLFYYGILISSIAYMLYLSAFVSDDFSLLEVYSYSTSGLPIWLKVSASWAGMGGSFFLWTILMIIIAFVFRYKTEGFEEPEVKVYVAYDLVIASLAVLTIFAGTFEIIDFRPPAGASLNPLLRSFWMLIHPLFTFAGYALLVAFAIYVLLGRGWTFWERVTAGLGWINLSIGIIAGAIWAYVVLGWGGYWAWDPVETAELVPWLAVTAYFHSMGGVGEGGRRLMAALTGFYTFYSSFMTKAGAQFTASVHSFSMSQQVIGLVLLHFLLGLSIIGLYLHDRGRLSLRIPRKPLSLFLTFAWWSLSLLSVVEFMGIFTPIVYYILSGGNRISVGPQYFNLYSYPLVMLFIISLVGCSLRNLQFKKYLLLISSAFAVGVFLVLLRFPSGNWMANFGLPISILALISAVTKLGMDIIRRSVLNVGISITHIAIPLILIAVFINATMGSSITVKANLNEPVITPYGIVITYRGSEIMLSNNMIFHRGAVIPEMAYGFFMFDIRSQEPGQELVQVLGETQMYHVVHKQTPGQTLFYAWIHFAYQCGTAPRPYTMGWTLDDIYISIIHADYHGRLRPIILNAIINQTQPMIEYIILSVKYEPFVNLVWLGSGLLVIGEAVFISEYISKYMSSRRKRKDVGGEEVAQSHDSSSEVY